MRFRMAPRISTKYPRNTTPTKPEPTIRTWLPIVLGIATVALGALAYTENRREKTIRYLQDVDEVRKILPEPVLNSSKPVDKTVLATADRRLTTLAKQEKNRPEALALHAAVANSMGDAQIAYSLANSALRNDPDNPNALIIKGLLDQEEGRTRESELTLRRAIEAATERQLPIESAVAKLNLANQLVGQGRLEEANVLLADPRQNKATRALAYNTSAIVLLRKGDLEGAAKDFKEAVASDPGYLKALFNLACTLERTGKHEEAQQDFERIASAGAKLGTCPTGGGGGGDGGVPDVIPDSASKPGYWKITYEDP